MSRLKRKVLFLSTALAAWLNFSAATEAPAAAPVVSYGASVQSRNGAVTAQPGDTVESIAKLYRLPAEDIIAANNLTAPYKLSPRQKLILPMPRDHKVGRNDTLYSLSRMYGVTPEHIAAVNHIDPPYHLHLGQMLRIPQPKGDRPEATHTSATAPSAAKAQHVPTQAELAPKFLAVPESKRRPAQASSSGLLLKKPGPSPEHKAFDSLLGKIAGDEAAQKRHEAATVPPPSLIAPAEALPTDHAEYVSNSHRAGFIWPVRGQVISSYGPKEGGLYNDGINIAAPRGTPVKAAADGTVAYVGDKLQSYGNLVLIRHPGGMITAYAHLNNVTVHEGMSVRKGQAIGSVGSTGTVANAQLHFEVRRGTSTLDPKNYLG